MIAFIKEYRRFRAMQFARRDALALAWNWAGDLSNLRKNK